TLFPMPTSRAHSPERRLSSEDLYDHRFQPQSLPRHNAVHSATGRRPSGSLGASNIPEPDFNKQFDYELRNATKDDNGSDDFIVGNVVMEDLTDEERTPAPGDIDRSTKPKARTRGENNTARRCQPAPPIFVVRERSPSRSPSPH